MEGSGIEEMGDESYEVLVKNLTDWTILGYRRAGFDGWKKVEKPIGKNCGQDADCPGDRLFLVGSRTRPFEVEMILANDNKPMCFSFPYEIRPKSGGFQYPLTLGDEDVDYKAN